MNFTHGNNRITSVSTNVKDLQRRSLR